MRKCMLVCLCVHVRAYLSLRARVCVCVRECEHACVMRYVMGLNLLHGLDEYHELISHYL